MNTTVSAHHLPKRHPLLITSAYERLLEGISTYHLVTASQLTRRYYSRGSLTLVKEHLKTLSDDGFVQHIEGRAPTEPHVYTLARRGLNYLREAGFDLPAYFRPSEARERGELFLRHTLALNDFLITAALVNRVSPALTLSEMHHERMLKRRPILVSVPLAEMTASLRFVPDAYLLFTSESRRVPVLVELDRGTEAQRQFRRKLRCYIELLRSHQYKEIFDLDGSITIAYATTCSTKRVAEMRAWARREFANTQEKGWLSDRFLFSWVPAEQDAKRVFLSPLWYRPFDDDPIALLPKE